MENITIGGGEVAYLAPSIPPEYSQLLAAHTAVVKTALQELNLRIADQIANNSGYQQAMYAGAVGSFFDVFVE